MDINDLQRSLFKEPDESLEREDAWSEPKGFMIGGFVLPSKRDLAQQYFDATNALVESIQRDEWEDYRLAYPALFLYRHSLELMLKEILHNEGNKHHIGQLTDDLRDSENKRYGIHYLLGS
jgi:hypothetical protein